MYFVAYELPCSWLPELMIANLEKRVSDDALTCIVTRNAIDREPSTQNRKNVVLEINSSVVVPSNTSLMNTTAEQIIVLKWKMSLPILRMRG